MPLGGLGKTCPPYSLFRIIFLILPNPIFFRDIGSDVIQRSTHLKTNLLCRICRLLTVVPLFLHI